MMRTLTRAVVLLLVVTGSAALVGCTSDPDLTGPSEPTVDLTAPAIPTQLTPSPNTTFNHYPRNTTLAWASVADPSGPVTYRVEVQYCQGNVYSPYNCVTRSDWCTGALSGTTCNFGFVGAQPGRWRVQAVDNAGNHSAYGDWSTFAFSI
jgi:hypothetical protein